MVIKSFKKLTFQFNGNLKTINEQAYKLNLTATVVFNFTNPVLQNFN